MIHNKLDKLFGQAGSILGWMIMLVGIYSSILPLTLLLVLIGSFMAFSYSGIYLDKDDEKYKFYYAYFGLFKSGSWRSLKNIDRVAGISSIILRDSYIPEQKETNLKTDDCFVVLFLKNRNRRIPFKRCKDLLEAKLEAQKIGQLLNLNVIH
ncbi:hypothetical protein GQR60_12345 [Labilibaculum sp. A4]|uniref:hypothetical protein n=1 Tax=Labilibaculum TaxID=2060722 RepID=UPI000F620291|nr:MULTISPECIES: hypothetical protein [Labilibaculum]MBN2597177.1 hypothetical protein [Marinifilaceae bacterium]MDQ1771343.1 hypothetical protein [Labilibaculum euxinus]MWN77131.1 hypothetical protein [Labilibaculum euxinus]